MQNNPELVCDCVSALRDQRDVDKKFMVARNKVVDAFGTLCTRNLEHCFLRPLLTHLGLLESFESTAACVPGVGDEKSKYDALFYGDALGVKYRRSVVETAGVSNFQVLHMKVQDIVGEMEEIQDAEHVFAFAQAVHEAADEAQNVEMIDRQEPFHNFFERVYPSYLDAISKAHNYFLSDLELLALCRCAKVNVVVFKHDLGDHTFSYLRHCIVNAAEPLLMTSIRVDPNAASVRSHFEKLTLSPTPSPALAAQEPEAAASAGRPAGAPRCADASSSSANTGRVLPLACDVAASLPAANTVGTTGASESTGTDQADPSGSNAQTTPTSAATDRARSLLAHTSHASAGSAQTAPILSHRPTPPAALSTQTPEAASSASKAAGVPRCAVTSLKDADAGVSPPLTAHVAGSATAAIAAGATVASDCRSSCSGAAAQTFDNTGSAQGSTGEPPWWEQDDGICPPLEERASSNDYSLEDAELEHGPLEAAELDDGRASSHYYSDTDNDDDNSDEEDLFQKGVSAKVPEEYTNLLNRWKGAISELTDHLRDDAMLPFDHRAEGEPCVCADAKSGIDLPAWHCPFLNHGVGMQRTPCQARAGRPSGNSGKTGTYEKELWAHVSGSHGHVLKAICKKWKLQLGKWKAKRCSSHYLMVRSQKKSAQQYLSSGTPLTGAH